MHEAIDSLLNTLETEHGCRVLFACESGSRAWGFASPDSDYDVRFIYAHSLEWYLRVKPGSDTIERMAPGDLDFGGWDLRKALSLMAGGNVPLQEWLGSPIIYRDVEGLLTDLQALVPDCFNARKAFHHYHRMALGVASKSLQGNCIGIKKLFYIVRPLLACRWIECRHCMPPTDFHRMLRQGLVDPTIEAWIHAQLGAKADLAESAEVDIPDKVLRWMETSLSDAAVRIDALPVSTAVIFHKLDALLFRIVAARGG